MRRSIITSLTLSLILLLVLISEKSIAGPPDAVRSETGWSPFQSSIYNPVQLVDERKDISGLRLSLLYGENVEITGIDLGIGLNVSKKLSGIQVAGLANLVSDYLQHRTASSVTGIQIAGLGNQADHLSGVQIGGFGNGVEFDAAGIQIGLIGNGAGTIKGIQLARIYNYTEGSMTGMQIGAFNFADSVTGLQIGLFNKCRKLSGMQLGLVNHIEQSRFSYLPIINAAF